MAEISLAYLTKNEARNLSGHERGEAAREHFDLDRLDNAPEEVAVIIPRELDALTTSFFQGMFSKSFQRFASEEAFFRHYRFDASPIILRQIARGINVLRMDRSKLA